MPARNPPSTCGEVIPPGARRATYLPTSTTTSNAAPAAAAKNTTPRRSLVTKPPSQAPRIAGAPATTASTASRCQATDCRSASGAAIPSPSVTLWIMKPTTKNVPSASSPSANDDPIAKPSPRLWRPIPIATSVASATPPRLDRQERQQPRRQSHERREPLGRRAPQRRKPQEPQRHRHDPDERPDQRIAEEAARRRLRSANRRRQLLRRLDSCRARDADRDRLIRHPVVLHDDLARAQATQGVISVDVEWHDRVVDGHRRDRELVALRVGHPDSDLARVELDPPDVELIDRRRALAEEAGHRAAGGREQRDHR